VADKVDKTAEAANKLNPSRWVDDHGDVLYRFALARLRSDEAAENIVQETLLAALNSQASYKGGSSERTWLIGILKHKILDSYRQREVVWIDEESENTEVEQRYFDGQGRWLAAPEPWNQPEKALENEQFRVTLQNCLEGLPQKTARVFMLREADDLDTEEICKILGITATHLGVLMHRARFQLRRCLEQHWFGAATEGPHA
jgi:RNA polymerase sigma-70 factor (ECF subfamily)